MGVIEDTEPWEGVYRQDGRKCRRHNMKLDARVQAHVHLRHIITDIHQLEQDTLVPSEFTPQISNKFPPTRLIGSQEAPAT